MSRIDLLLALGALLFVLGGVRLLVSTDLIRRVICLNVAGSGVFLVLLTLAVRAGEDEPDPVLQALVLTGIVIAVSVTALALILIRRLDSVQQDDRDETPDPRPAGEQR